jgi:hypothetical protein
MMQQYSPAFQFQQQQGMQGVLNGDSSSVGALSGAASKDLIDYNQSLANTAFNNAFNLYQQQQGNVFNRLMGITGLGQTAAANTGAQGTTLAGNIGSAQIAGGNAMGTAFSNMGNAAGNAASNYAWMNTLNNNNPYASDPTSFSMGGGGSVVSDPGYGG